MHGELVRQKIRIAFVDDVIFKLYERIFDWKESFKSMQNLNFRRTQLSFFSQLFLIDLALLNNGKTWKKTQNKYWICITTPQLRICWWKLLLVAEIRVMFSNYFTLYVYISTPWPIFEREISSRINQYVRWVCMCFTFCMQGNDSEGLFIWIL